MGSESFTSYLCVHHPSSLHLYTHHPSLAGTCSHPYSGLLPSSCSLTPTVCSPTAARGSLGAPDSGLSIPCSERWTRPPHSEQTSNLAHCLQALNMWPCPLPALLLPPPCPRTTTYPFAQPHQPLPMFPNHAWQDLASGPLHLLISLQGTSFPASPSPPSGLDSNASSPGGFPRPPKVAAPTTSNPVAHHFFPVLLLSLALITLEIQDDYLMVYFCFFNVHS